MAVNLSELISVGMAAKALPFTEASLRARIQRGEIKTVLIAGRVFLSHDELRRVFGARYQPRPAA